MKEIKISSNKIYQGKFIKLYKDQVKLQNNQVSTREYINHPGAVVILSFLKNDNILLVKQFRYAINKICIELPAGKIENNENPKQTAERELIEETGYKAEKLELISYFYPCIGYVNEKIYFYLAEKLSKSKIYKKDDDENIKIIKLPYKKALSMVKAGKIIDLKTIASLLLMKDKLNKI